MVPPLVLHPPPFFSLAALSSSSGTQCPSEAFVLVSAQARTNLLPSSSAAFTLGFQNTEGGHGVRACLLPPGTVRIRFFVNRPSLSMAPSVRCASDTLRPHKRLCKVPEISKGRSRISIADGVTTSDCKQGFKSIFKAAAFTRHGRSEVAVMELEQPAEDCLQLQNIQSHGKKTTCGRMKSAEELHFEAVEDYCRKYEDEVDSHHVNDVANGVTEPGALPHEAPQSPVHVYAAVVDSDVANTPVDESNYVNGAVPWHSDVKALQYQGNGCKVVLEKTLMQNGLGKQTAVIDDVAEINVSQSLRNADERSTKRKKSTQMKTIPSGPLKVSARRIAQASKVSPLESSGAVISESKTVGLDLSQHHSEVYTSLQQEESQSKDNDRESEEESTKFEVVEDLSEQQKIRMDLNKAAALARRNMRVCEDAVAEAQAQGLSFPKFESLLVEKSWAEVLRLEFPKLYMERLHQFVSQEAAGRIPIYPPPAKLFNAFNSCPFDRVKVVIIGQDPYHGPGQAMGLCFSVEKGIKIPSSLSNIFLEIESDVRCDFPSHGNLEKWAHQGVLLLNTVLTVRDHHANSHAKKGWELFTDAAIRALAQQRSGVVFLLWGNQAQEKLRLINNASHHVLKAFHPSGISAHKGFFKCRHFSKTNQILVDEGLLPIDWQL